MLLILQHMEDQSVSQGVLGLAEASWKNLVEKFCPGTLREKGSTACVEDYKLPPAESMTMKLHRFCVILPLKLHSIFPQNPEAGDCEATHQPTYSVLWRCCKNLELCMMQWCHVIRKDLTCKRLRAFHRPFLHSYQTWSHACHAITLSLKRRRQKTVPISMVTHGDLRWNTPE